MARRYAREVLAASVSQKGEKKEEVVTSGSPDTIAGLSAVTLAIQLTPPKGGPPWFCIVRAAVLPPGYVVATGLLTQNMADIRLLDRVSRDLRLRGMNSLGGGGGDDE